MVDVNLPPSQSPNFPIPILLQVSVHYPAVVSDWSPTWKILLSKLCNCMNSRLPISDSYSQFCICYISISNLYPTLYSPISTHKWSISICPSFSHLPLSPNLLIFMGKWEFVTSSWNSGQKQTNFWSKFPKLQNSTTLTPISFIILLFCI